MKIKTLFYALAAVFILSFSSCHEEEKDENTDCGCEKPEIQAVLGISDSI